MAFVVACGHDDGTAFAVWEIVLVVHLGVIGVVENEQPRMLQVGDTIYGRLPNFVQG